MPGLCNSRGTLHLIVYERGFLTVYKQIEMYMVHWSTLQLFKKTVSIIKIANQ